MPSRSLAAYVAKLFSSRFIMLLAMLVILLQMMDLLNQSDKILAAEGATHESLLAYVRWRTPELISQFIPFATLLAVLFSLASLNQHSEVIIMRASGLAPGQIMAPMFMAAILIAVGHVIFHDYFVVSGSAKLAHWRDHDYSLTAQEAPEGRQNIWLQDESLILEAGGATRAAKRALLDSVTLFNRDKKGVIHKTIHADFAINDSGGPTWTLYGLRKFDLESGQMRTKAMDKLDLNIPQERIYDQIDRPEYARIGKLARSISSLKKVGVETFTLETALLHRFTRALAIILMPLLAALAAFGTPRMGVGIGRVVLGMGIGFSYFVFENYMTAMGTMGILPPLLAITAAPGVYLLIGLAILIRSG